MSFNENRKSAHKELGETQDELVEHLVVTRQSVLKYKIRERWPKIEKLIQVVC